MIYEILFGLVNIDRDKFFKENIISHTTGHQYYKLFKNHTSIRTRSAFLVNVLLMFGILFRRIK